MRAFSSRAAVNRALILDLIAAALAIALPVGALAAQDHAGTDHHDGGLHFTHPLFTESVSPDTKVRIDYGFQDLDGDDDENELELEGEYAFSQWFSLEAGVHFDPEAGERGDTHVLLKFANPAFEQAGVLLGYGVELGLPTGTSHTHSGAHEEGEAGHETTEADEDIYQITPYLNAGWMSGDWELVGWTLFDIPTNQADQHDVGTRIRYHASALRHLGGRFDALLEAFGDAGLSGPDTNRTVLNLAPGIRVRPFPRHPLVLGGGVAFPLTREQAFEARLLVSGFYHL